LGSATTGYPGLKKILESATTSILLNGVPGKKICCKRGVRQRDPMSPPPPFVLIAELLQCNVKQGLFYLPIPSRDGVEFVPNYTLCGWHDISHEGLSDRAAMP
jgi:hypothetical protein